MDNEIRVQRPALHTLIPLEDFKAILGIDDREDALSRYCLIMATYTIEQYCRRSLFVHRHFERFEYAGDLLLPLRFSPALGRLPGYRCSMRCTERSMFRVKPRRAWRELAVWNMGRYRWRRIGMAGNVRGSGKDGEHLET